MAATMTHLTDELLDTAADGDTLAPADAEHLRACAECQANVERLRALRGRLAALPQALPTDSDLWPTVHGAIRARRRRRLVFTSSLGLALAAALLIAVVRIGNGPDAVPSSVETSVELAELKAVAPPVVVEAMAANLTIYDAALRELEAFAASERDNADVQQRIEELRRKRAALLRLASNS
jgi:anti-sigma factor RsiW